MLKYVALDVETTGRDPSKHQVLELALVVETDWVTPVADLPCLRLTVDHPLVCGELRALTMNRDLLAEICQRGGDANRRDAWGKVRQFLRLFFPDDEKVTVAGKNAAGFDLPFCEATFEGWERRRFYHRVLDVGSLYVDPFTDARLPDSAECMRRAGLPGAVPHTALDDARLVVQMVRRHFARGALPVSPVPFVGAPLPPAMLGLAEVDEAA